MPARQEFETEFDNDVEHLVKDMEFHDSDTEADVQLKSAILDIYNTTLSRRAERKKFIFQNDFTEFRKVVIIPGSVDTYSVDPEPGKEAGSG